MVANRDDRPAVRRRGRPRQTPEGRLVRRNILVDPRDLQRLRAWYGARSDAEAVRSAIYSVLTWAAGREIQQSYAEHGGLDDVYGRTTGVSRLPVHVEPGDLPPEELISLDDDATHS